MKHIFHLMGKAAATMVMLIGVNARAGDDGPVPLAAMFQSLMDGAPQRTTRGAKQIEEGEVERIRGLADSEDVTKAMPGIAAMWVNGSFASVENVWWRQKSRPARIMVLTFFYSLGETRKTEGFPNFDKLAARFAPAEAEERREEIALVEENLDVLLLGLHDTYVHWGWKEADRVPGLEFVFEKARVTKLSEPLAETLRKVVIPTRK